MAQHSATCTAQPSSCDTTRTALYDSSETPSRASKCALGVRICPVLSSLETVAKRQEVIISHFNLDRGSCMTRATTGAPIGQHGVETCEDLLHARPLRRFHVPALLDG